MNVKRLLKWSVPGLLVVVIIWFQIAYWSSTNDCARLKAAPTTPMKAVVRCEYGSPDVLHIEQVEKPVPADNQILVKVRAVSINAADGHFVRGPVIARFINGLRKPKEIRVGLDFSGTVEATGKDTTRFKPGDEVFGAKTGALAEYVCVKERGIVPKPANMKLEQVAAVPVAAVTALQGMRDYGHVGVGQKVLINGASGGVGTFAIQIAKALGAEVTAVCSSRNLDQARALGADHVIDYTTTDFTNGADRYDVIFDNVGNHSFAERRRVLTPKGICVLVGIGGAGAHPGQWMRLFASVRASLASRLVDQKFVMFIASLRNEDLKVLADLMQSGKVAPVIDKMFPLDHTADAFRYLETGHARGKIVINVESPVNL